MKIVIATGIYPPEIGGPATFVREFASALNARGDELVVVTYGDSVTEQREEWPVIVIPRVGGVFIRYVRYAWHVYVQARTAKVVFLQGAVSEGFPGTIGAMLAGKPTVMRVPGDYAWEMSMQSSGGGELLDEFIAHRHRGWIRLLEALERWSARWARCVITPSQYLKHIVQQWGVSKERVEVIYNSVPPLPAPTMSGDALRMKYDLVGKAILFTVVRAVPWKGVDFLIEVLAKLPETAVLVYAGDGPMLETWKRQAAKVGLASRVRFLGRVNRSELSNWYAAADIFLLASGYEGFPYVVVEAVSTGLACVVSDRGGNPETRTLFPEYVRVSPYRDVEAWRVALTAPPARRLPASSQALDYSTMLRGYATLLDRYAGSPGKN